MGNSPIRIGWSVVYEVDSNGDFKLDSSTIDKIPIKNYKIYRSIKNSPYGLVGEASLANNLLDNISNEGSNYDLQ